jgi:two-component system sensor histidine kinase UhpB
MSLRTRIVGLIALVLLVSVLLGALAAALEARKALREELQAALAGGEQTAASAFEDLPRSDHPARDLRQLAATFNGNRHLRAVLKDGHGSALLASQPPRFTEAPRWFAGALGPAPDPVDISVPAVAAPGRILELQPMSGPDEDAIWRELWRPVVLLLSAAVIGLLLVFLAMGAAIQPLRRMSAALARIGEGDYGERVPEQGPPELVRLQRSFNGMAEQLAAMRGQNRALEAQLSTIQDEERAELARELHDDIGPYLFSVTVDAQLVGGLLAKSAPAEVRDRLRGIQDAVAHMQRLVRDILGRLRPTPITELGLAPAVDDLVAFWRARRPNVTIDLRLMNEDALPMLLTETVFRVLQEGLNNAMRHAEPNRVLLSVQRLAASEVEVLVANDGKRHTTSPQGGFGLLGLRERVQALGGRILIDRGEDGGEKWTLTVRLPLAPGQATAEAALA